VALRATRVINAGETAGSKFEGRGVPRMKKLFLVVSAPLGLTCFLCARTKAQQTLGSINGTVTEVSESSLGKGSRRVGWG